MTKQEIIEEIVQREANLGRGRSISKATAGRAFECIFEIITDTLNAGEPISIHGFGSFKTVTRRAKAGRNPSTGEAIEIPEHKAVKFTPSNNLKAQVY